MNMYPHARFRFSFSDFGMALLRLTVGVVGRPQFHSMAHELPGGGGAHI